MEAAAKVVVSLLLIQTEMAFPMRKRPISEPILNSQIRMVMGSWMVKRWMPVPIQWTLRAPRKMEATVAMGVTVATERKRKKSSLRMLFIRSLMIPDQSG